MVVFPSVTKRLTADTDDTTPMKSKNNQTRFSSVHKKYRQRELGIISNKIIERQTMLRRLSYKYNRKTDNGK